MTTTPQTLTLSGDDYVVIPRDEYERLRPDDDEDAAHIAAIKRVPRRPRRDLGTATAPAPDCRRGTPVRVSPTHRRMTARALAVVADIRRPTPPPSSAT